VLAKEHFEGFDLQLHTKQSVYHAKEIMKLPYKPVHVALLDKIVSTGDIFSAGAPKFHFRVLSAWQRELKSA